MKIYLKYTSYTVLLLMLWSCGNTNEEQTLQSTDHQEREGKVMLTKQQFEALQIRVDTLAYRNMNAFVAANGKLEVPPQNEATITAIVGANVASIDVVEGDEVKKGQVVAYLSHPSIIAIQTDYLNAYNTSILLEKEYERQQKLYNAGVGSGINFQKAEAEFLNSKARVNGLETQLKQFNINAGKVQQGTIYQRVSLRSPIDGFVQKVEVKTGQFVEPQTDLFEIVNTHHVHADLMVFEKDVNKVKEGQHVRFQIQAMPDKELTATIYSVSKTFEQEPKAVHVHAEINNKQENLIPGMYIQGRIAVKNSQTIALPQQAIGQIENRDVIFTAQKEGGNWYFKPMEIVRGTEEGDWVSISFLQAVEPQTLFAYNNAYYLIAELNKGEAEHSH